MKHIKQPNNTTCGQTCVAMISGIPVEKSIELHGTDKGTTLRDSKKILYKLGILTGDVTKIDNRKKWELPDFCGVRIVPKGCKWGHFIVYKEGKFYDPARENGVFEGKEELLKRYNSGTRKWRFSHYFEILKK